MTSLLAGDLGGTKTLLAIYSDKDSSLDCLHFQRFTSKEWSSLRVMLRYFLTNLPDKISYPDYGCIAVAGKVQNNEALITNLPWRLKGKDLAAEMGITHIELVNDFAVLVHGLRHFSAGQQVVLQDGEHLPGPSAILGAGTGLGMARGIPFANELIALPSEGGHREFSPRTEEEWQLAVWLRDDLDLKRLSIERVVSGTGLGHIASWLLQKPEASGHPLRLTALSWRQNHNIVDLPAHVSKAAAKGDRLMEHALQLWLGAYGAAAGDLILQELCSGGLWIGGGTAAKQLSGLRSPAFLDPMRAKGRFEPFVSSIPVHALIDPGVGLFSAACRARMLVELGGTLT